MIAKVYDISTREEVNIGCIDKFNVVIEPKALYPFDLSKKIAQTAKAYGFRYFLVEYIPEQDICYFVANIHWFPKSKMMHNFAPGWAMIAKAKEVFEQILEQDANLLDKAAEGLYDLDNIFIYFSGYRIAMSDIEY